MLGEEKKEDYLRVVKEIIGNDELFRKTQIEQVETVKEIIKKNTHT